MGVKIKIKNGKTLAVFDFSTVSRTLWESKSKSESPTSSHFVFDHVKSQNSRFVFDSGQKQK
jgi:hypothetical protein